MLWIIILLCIVCYFVCELSDNIVANAVSLIVTVVIAIVSLCIIINYPIVIVHEGEKSTYNISEFSESLFHKNNSNDDDIMCYSYVIDGEEYKIDNESDDIYSIECTKSQPTTVTIQKNTYRSIATFFTTEMYCYTFE